MTAKKKPVKATKVKKKQDEIDPNLEEKKYGVVFVAQEPVERKGVYKSVGSFEDVKQKLVEELVTAFGRGKFEIKVFQELKPEDFPAEAKEPNERVIN